MLDQAHDAILLLTLDGRIVYANDAADRLFGWASGEMLGKTAVDAYPAEDQPALRQAVAET